MFYDGASLSYHGAGNMYCSYIVHSSFLHVILLLMEMLFIHTATSGNYLNQCGAQIITKSQQTTMNNFMFTVFGRMPLLVYMFIAFIT